MGGAVFVHEASCGNDFSSMTLKNGLGYKAHHELRGRRPGSAELPRHSSNRQADVSGKDPESRFHIYAPPLSGLKTLPHALAVLQLTSIRQPTRIFLVKDSFDAQTC